MGARIAAGSMVVAAVCTVLPDDPPPTVQLTPNPLPGAAWTDFESFAVDPYAAMVVYQSDPAGDGAYQIFSVPIVGGTASVISHAAATSNIEQFAITADGLRVVYRTDTSLHSNRIESGGMRSCPDPSTR